MSDVDAILASGRYIDRRGRKWTRVTWGGTVEELTKWTRFPYDRTITPDQMRLKIVREQHRDECTGLLECTDHPVVMVYKSPFGTWSVYSFDPPVDSWGRTFAEAMDAARQLAGGRDE